MDKRIDKEFLTIFREKANEALKSVEEELGVTINLNKIKYSDYEFDLAVNVKVGSKEEAERREFEKYCRMYDLKPEDYLKEFTSKGKLYKIVGFQPTRRKYPYECKEVLTGKSILFTDAILKLLQ